jgi:hypothetical protein
MRSLSCDGVRLPKFIVPRATSGGWPAFLLGIGFTVMAQLSVARLCLGHTIGLSTAELVVTPGGRVEARFVFASAEPLGRLVLDRNRDGLVTAEDVAAAKDDLAAFLLEGVDVTADGNRCQGTFREATLSEIDGLVLEASYRCPEDMAEIAVNLYYLSSLPRAHREIARIVAVSASTEAVLTGDRRALALRLPEDGRGRGAARHVAGRRFALGAALAAGLVALLVWRRRAARRTV